MILIGQYDSPFVRRVGVAMHLYGLAWEHRPFSSFREGEKFAAQNPLRRVPTLVLDDGEVLIESAAILDHLDGEVGPDRAMLPAAGIARRRALQIIALATGAADKAVALVYEKALHPEPAAVWVDRCTRQIGDALAVLEARRAAAATPFLSGPSIGHADIALACVVRFVGDAHPALFDPAQRAALAAHAARCEAMEAFRAVQQVFIAPA